MTNSNSNSKTKKEAQDALDRFKMEVASEIGVNLKEGYNGDLTSAEACIFLEQPYKMAW